MDFGQQHTEEEREHGRKKPVLARGNEVGAIQDVFSRPVFVSTSWVFLMGSRRAEDEKKMFRILTSHAYTDGHLGRLPRHLLES